MSGAPYSDSTRRAAVRRVMERRSSEPDNRAILREVALEFDVLYQTLWRWVQRYDDGSYSYPEPFESHSRTEPQEKVSATDTGDRYTDENRRLLAENRQLTKSVANLSETVLQLTKMLVEKEVFRINTTRATSLISRDDQQRISE